MSTDRRQRDELLLLHSHDFNVDRSSTATDLLLGETREAADYETTRAEHTYIYTARKLLFVYSFLFFFPLRVCFAPLGFGKRAQRALASSYMQSVGQSLCRGSRMHASR